jgi:peptide/nickel transport system substrate-binding protein
MRESPLSIPSRLRMPGPRAFAAGILPVVFWLLAGCAPGDRESNTDTAPATLTIHYESDERVFSPAHWVQHRFLVFATLFRWDENGKMQGWLADRWEHSDDYRTWTYHLRENARWHDGVPVTTADIEFTLGLLSNPVLVVLDPDDFELTVIDEHTFSVTAETPDAGGFMQWELICFPKHLLENLDPAGYYDWDWWIQPVGNGPFRYVRHEPRTFTELEADPDYFLDPPAIERVRLRYGGSGDVEMMAGNVDLSRSSSLATAKRLAKDPRFVMYAIPAAPWAIFWNGNRPRFRDAETRRALTLAIDRRALFAALDIPDDVPVTDASFNFGSQGQSPVALPYDTVAARRLLAEAGWKDGDGDGVLERDGAELRFELLVFGAGADASVLVHEYLRRIGAHVSIATTEMSVARNRMRGGDFDAGIFRTSRGYLEDFLFGSRNILQVRPQSLQSPIGYSNPLVLEALETAAASFEDGAGARATAVLWAEFQRDVPATFLHPEMAVLLANRRVRGIRPPYNNVIGWLDRLWIEEEG